MKSLPLLTFALATLVGASAFGQQYRYTNPSQTQAAPAPAPAPSSAPVSAPSGGGAAPTVEGAAPASPAFVNDTVEFGQPMHYGYVEAQDIYRGIIPGIQDSLPHISRYQARSQAGSATNVLTWIGFQPFEDSTRIFIQTGRAARYAVNASPDGMTLTVRIQDARISLYNFRREMDASWFQRSVNSIQAFRNGSYVDVVIELNEAMQYNATQSGEYIFLDFAD